MELIRKFAIKNNVYTWMICGIIVALSVSFIGYMVGQFIWYLDQ